MCRTVWVSYGVGVRARRLVLLAVGVVLLSTAWVFATPPFQAPDEAAQYLRALTIANGHLLGPKVGVTAADRVVIAGGGWRAEQRRWILHDQRSVLVSAALSPPNVSCADGHTDSGRSGCDEVTYTGDYYPIGYLLPAAGIAVSHSVGSAQWLSRIGSLIPALAFIVLALVLVGWRSGWATVGLLGAITPSVLFIASVLNPSGLEVAANLAFVAALLRLRRDAQQFPAWGWLSLGVSGVVTVLAWQLGPVFAAIDLAAVIGLSPPGEWSSLLITRRGALIATGLALIAATGLFAAYGESSGVVHSDISFTPLLASLRAGAHQLAPTLREAVGSFGSLNSNLPAAMPALWWLGILALTAGALTRGTRRERVILVLICGAAVAFPVLFYAWSQRRTGFGMQGRYVLPLLALIPIIAGETLERHSTQTSQAPSRLHAAILTAIALFQLAAWWINADHWANTSASGLISQHAGWNPPLGWWAWLALATLGTLALLGSVTDVRITLARRQTTSAG
jgi:hypothetical protein